MSGARADSPATMQDARSVRAGFILAAVSLALMALTVLWLLYVCGMGTWPGLGNKEVQLSAWHLLHLLLDVPALLLFPLAVLFLPVWFAAIGLAVLFLDVYVAVARFLLFSTTPNLACTLFLFFFDLLFLLLAVFYLGFALAGISRFSLFGNGSVVKTPYTLPRAADDAKGDAAAPVQQQQQPRRVAVDSGAPLASGIPPMYIGGAKF